MTATNTRFMKRTLHWMRVLILFTLFATTVAFPVVAPSVYSLRHSNALLAKSRGDDFHRDDVYALNKARTDIRNFLTQRSLQSFLFLLSTCRDSATVRWLEVSATNMGNCHCCASLDCFYEDALTLLPIKSFLSRQPLI